MNLNIKWKYGNNSNEYYNKKINYIKSIYEIKKEDIGKEVKMKK